MEVCIHAKAAVERFREAPNRFDLVITDLTMPDMNGIQLITILKVLRPSLPVILCTGYGHTLDHDALEALGVEALLTQAYRNP